MDTLTTVGMPIRLLPKQEKPRERMLLKGASSLSNAELIAILMGSGSSRASAIDLGNLIIRKFGELRNIASADFAELVRIPGLGPAKATKLAAAFELGRRRMAMIEKGARFNSPRKLSRFLRPIMMDCKKEVFVVMFLNTNLNLLGYQTIAVGGLNSVMLDPRVVFREAALREATRIVISHNHPSGNEKPSDADELVTERIVHAGIVMEIKLLDHIIITHNGYYSFSESGKLEEAKKRVERVRRAARLGTDL